MITIDEQTKKLLDEMGFVPTMKDPKDYIYTKDNIEAHVDFRKVNGRRWAKINGEFVKENELDEKVPTLKLFKEERNKLQSLGIEHAQKQPETDGNREHGVNHVKAHVNTLDNSKGGETVLEGDKTSIRPTQDSITTPGLKASPPGTIQEQQSKPPQTASQSPNLYKFFYELVGPGGIIEIFGDTGSLKSNCCVETCKDAKKLNKTYFYLDTEGKVGLMNKQQLGKDYEYLPVWNKILEKIEKELPKADLLIVDSIGFPVSTQYSSMKANQQGETLQEMMEMVGKHLKVWAFNNNAIVIFTNQPKSTFMKSAEELARLDPFGDKVHFAASIILKAQKSILKGHYDNDLKKVIPPKSIGTYTSHRSTDFMDDVTILSIIKNDDEVKIEIPKFVTERLDKLKGGK